MNEGWGIFHLHLQHVNKMWVSSEMQDLLYEAKEVLIVFLP